ncbi:MAG: hypothetical protein QOE19_1443 [Actinomycetota bacterium]|nr:hypothetical protein [Actinomycetota bacterium]
MRLPEPSGPLSAAAIRVLSGASWRPRDLVRFARDVDSVDTPLTDADLQLALACCYEMHYRGFEDADERLEWSPELAGVVAALECRFEAALREIVSRRPTGLPVDQGLRAVTDDERGPSLSAFLMRHADADQFRDFLVQRSIYHLKEADPHTWQIPRLGGPAKAALVEIQMDEYGGGRLAGMHATLFAQTMRALGLDDAYGAYWPAALPETHAAVNLMTMLGIHRRHRGASLGHLAALEMTSTQPNRRYGNGLRRLGFDDRATAFFDEHVEADAVHEQIAAVDMCGAVVAAEPRLEQDVLWGAACCLAVDAAAAQALLHTWDAVEPAGAA